MSLSDVIKKGAGAPAPSALIEGGLGIDTLNKRIYFKAADGTVVPHDKNTPAGGISATTVQAAINELDTEKAPLASPVFTGSASCTGKIIAKSGVINANNTNNVGYCFDGGSDSGMYSDADGKVVIVTNSNKIATFQNSTLAINRTDSVSEGGQITLNRSLDDATAWSIDTFGSGANPIFRLLGHTNVALEVAQAGHITTPLQPAFIASLNVSGNLAAGGNLQWNESVDRNNNFDGTAFTAPVAGMYYFAFHLLLPNTNTGEYRFNLTKNDVINGDHFIDSNKLANTWQTYRGGTLMNLAAGDAVRVYYASGSGNIHNDANYASFYGYLLG